MKKRFGGNLKRIVGRLLCMTVLISSMAVIPYDMANAQGLQEDDFAGYTEEVFQDDFSDSNESEKFWSDTSYIADGTMTLPFGGNSNIVSRKFGNAVYKVDMAVNDGADWTGIMINRQLPSHTWDNSGCLVYMTNAGKIEIAGKDADGKNLQVVGVEIPEFEIGKMISFQIRHCDGNVYIYANDSYMLTVENIAASGYAGVWCAGSSGSGSVDNVSVWIDPSSEETEETKLIAQEDFEQSEVGEWDAENVYKMGGRQSVEVTARKPLHGEKSLVMKNNSDTGYNGANGLYARVKGEFGANDIVVRIRRNTAGNGVFRIVANSQSDKIAEGAEDNYQEILTSSPLAYNKDGTLNNSVTYAGDWKAFNIPTGFDGYLFLANEKKIDISNISFGMTHNSFQANTDNIITIDSIASYTGSDYAAIMKALGADDAYNKPITEDTLQSVQTETYVDQTAYKLPTVPENFTVRIHSSSDEKIIALDGGMTPPQEDKKVTLTFEVVNQITKESYISKPYNIQVAKKTDVLELKFFKELKYGLFVHYVWGGKNSVTLRANGEKVESPDELVMEEGAVPFAEACEEMGVQYVILTAWHAGMNPLYPSEVYKEYRTNEKDLPDTDILMPILDELNKRNIEVFFYTHPNDGHDMNDADKEKLGYAAGPDLDYEKWNDYLNAQYKELCERYKGKFRGMFLDEGLMDYNNEVFVDYPRLRNTVKKVDSSLVMMQNHYTGKYSCDTAMIENTHIWDADINNLDTWATFQYPTAFTITSTNNWAAIFGPDHVFDDSVKASVEDMFVYTVMQAATNTEGGGATWAAGPYAGGTQWENGILETLLAIGDYIEPIAGSIKNTLPSTSYVTYAGTRISKLDWGVATKSTDNSKEYIHVLKAPDSQTLTLSAPEDGKIFTSAKLFESGKKVELEQKEDGTVEITLPDGEDWDQYDTVIELSVDLEDYLNKYIQQAENLIAVGSWQYTEEGLNRFKETIADVKALRESGNTGELVEQLQDAVTVLGTCKQYYAPTENLAEGATVTASSNIGGSEWDVNYVVDGDRYCKLPYTNWNYNGQPKGWSSSADSDNPDHTEWIQLELENASDVGAVYLYPRNDKDFIGGGYPIDFKIEVSGDGNNWTEVYSETGCLRPDGSVKKYLFSLQENVKFIRVTGTKLRTDNDRGKDGCYRMQFAEIEVYGQLGDAQEMEMPSISPVSVTTTEGEKPILPDKVVGVYSDGTEREFAVDWDEIKEEQYEKAGEFTVEGTVADLDVKAYCTVKVIEKDEPEDAVLVSVKPASVITEEGKKPVLPDTVVGVYSDGTEKELAVVWDEIKEEQYEKAGEFKVEGTVEGLDEKVYCTVKVKQKEEGKPSDSDQDNNSSTSVNDNTQDEIQNKNEQAPQTGDTSGGLYAVAVLMAVSISASAAVCRRKRKF